jgi:hypothetical protein
LGGKGDQVIRWMEMNSSDGKLGELAIPFGCSKSLASFALVPKWGLDVMDTEIDRLLGVSSDGSSIIPFSVNVPRRVKIDFHSGNIFHLFLFFLYFVRYFS